MKKVLIALDFSELSSEVAKTGYEIAEKIGATVVLITIVNKYLDYSLALNEMSFSNQWEERLYYAQQKLEKLKNEYQQVATEIIAFIGDPKEDIIEAAFDKDICFVVVGKYGRTGFSHFIVGGTTQHIINHTTKPVIVVPFKKSRH